ncbi:hypothetical protein R3P38DRAFT_3267224 [Favolaschia claudopus]|uniref:Secreted protein n=1 Tax=Favolaschia claudopus TaxID=2862362 RepID=A0AAW0BNV4_9AGAR
MPTTRSSSKTKAKRYACLCVFSTLCQITVRSPAHLTPLNNLLRRQFGLALNWRPGLKLQHGIAREIWSRKGKRRENAWHATGGKCWRMTPMQENTVLAFVKQVVDTVAN